MIRLPITRWIVVMWMLSVHGHAESIESMTPAKILATERQTLHVGEQKSLHLGDPLRVNISRRGIIHLVESGENLWRMTGMRTGVVAIEVHSRGGMNHFIYVDVLPKPTTHTEKADPKRSLPSPVPLDVPIRQFFVKAQIELVEEQISETYGASGKGAAEFDLVHPSLATKINGVIEMRDRLFKRRVIGEPQFFVHEDEDAVVKSGGESLQDRTDDDGRHRDVWHEYGLSLSIKLRESPDHKVISDVLFALKSPSGAEQHFSLNHIQTRATLPYDERHFIGSVDLASNDQGEDKDSFFSQVPIIGPLFKRKTSSATKAMVQLWLEIKRRD